MKNTKQVEAPMKKLKGHYLNYNLQDKPQKRQVINFIRKYYPGVDFRDIYTGLHQAVVNEDRTHFIAVATNLQMVAQYKQAKGGDAR
jgi:hypothetical protein